MRRYAIMTNRGYLPDPALGNTMLTFATFERGVEHLDTLSKKFRAKHGPYVLPVGEDDQRRAECREKEK